MAKPIVQFNAVSFDVGGHQGLRPQLIGKDAIIDLDLCREIVNERRLTTSPEELMHGFSALVDVSMKKVAEDGHPRAITKLIKFMPYAMGSLESPSSPWNESCKAIVRAVLLSDAKKTLDATFQNVTVGIGVKLNDVTWIGAKSVQNVIKIGVVFAANGNHMEFIDGDSAVLKIGETEYPLVCTDSDVSHAYFEFPEALEGVEPGTQALFIMKSRGGVEDGQVYLTKKTVTILAGDGPREPRVLKVHSATLDRDDAVKAWNDEVTITLANGDKVTDARYELYKRETGETLTVCRNEEGNGFAHDEPSKLVYTLAVNNSPEPDGLWEDPENGSRFSLTTTDGETIFVPVEAIYNN